MWRSCCCCRWWWRRYRRRQPAAAAAAAALATILLLLLAHQRGVWQNAGYVSGSTVLDEGPPPPEPGLNTWVVVDGQGAGGAQVCSRTAGRYPGWTILIYGTGKPDGNSLSRCRYPPPAAGSQGDQLPPPADLSPQRQALLYAIQNGAEAIYIPAAGTQSSGPPPRVFTDKSYSSLLYTSSTSSSRHFDATRHFGCRLAPQDLPPVSGAATYQLCRGSPPPALQVLPWLPAAPTFTVTQEATHRKLALPRCDLHAPPITLDKDVLGHFRLHEALYTRAAFWALAAVEEVETESGGGRVVGSGGSGDLVVGYGIQRMLGLSGHRLLMRSDQPPEGSTTGGSTSPTRGHHSQYQHKAAQTITQWQCPAGTGGNNYMMHCVRALFTHLGALRLLPPSRVRNMVAWWDALEAGGHHRPEMQAPLAQVAPMGECIKDPVLYQPVGLQGEMVWSRYRPRPTLPLGNEQLICRTLNMTCSGINSQSSSNAINQNHPGLPHKALPVNSPTTPPVNLTQPWTQFQSVVLIVTFNLPHYDVIPYLELLYRPFFPYMVYCGPGLPNPSLHPDLSGYNLTFVSYSYTPGGHFPGSFNYQCVSLVVGLGLDVAGYLVISDDVYLSLTRLTELSLAAAWFVPQDQLLVGDLVLLKECRLGMCDFGPHWRWWEDYQSQTLSALSYLASHHRASHTMYRCHKQLLALTGSTKRAMGAYSDVYYVPRRLAADFSTILDVFLQHKVFLEIAVPSALLCLELPEQVVPINGLRVWDDTREAPAQHFNRRQYLGKTFLHPTKWSGLARGNLTTRDFYCNKILPHLHDPYGRFQQ